VRSRLRNCNFRSCLPINTHIPRWRITTPIYVIGEKSIGRSIDPPSVGGQRMDLSKERKLRILSWITEVSQTDTHEAKSLLWVQDHFVQ